MAVNGYASIAVGDMDNDGDYDIYVSGLDGKPLLIENNSTRGNLTEEDKNLFLIKRDVGLVNPLFNQKFDYGLPMSDHANR